MNASTSWRRLRVWIGIFGAVVATIASPAQAHVSTQLDDHALAARVNGEPVYTFSVETTLKISREKKPQISRTKVLEAIIVNRLLAAEAHRRFSKEELHESQRVAFARDVVLDDELVASLRKVYDGEIEAALHALPGASLNRVITNEVRLHPSALDAIFGTPDKLRLAYTLTSEQAATARQTALLRYRFPDGKHGTITLYDVYRRQNVQGRVELYNRNLDYMQQQARLNLASMFVLNWAQRKFGAPAVDDLRRTLSDRDDVQAVLQLYGIGGDIHAESKVLVQLATHVSQDEVTAYYQTHKQDFERIERVKARHIRIDDEALAKQVAATAAKGEDFIALARRYSQADDRAAGGDMGWIAHEGNLNWLAQLAYSQAVGKVSPPIRTPVGPTDPASWEIVLVEQREQGYQAPDSEAVRYIAGNAVAREKAVSQFKSMREELVRNASIELNSKVLDEPLELLVSKP